jgi:hypothetical protein
LFLKGKRDTSQNLHVLITIQHNKATHQALLLSNWHGLCNNSQHGQGKNRLHFVEVFNVSDKGKDEEQSVYVEKVVADACSEVEADLPEVNRFESCLQDTSVCR